MELLTLLSDLPRAKRFLPKLKKLGLTTVGDLVYHFPYRYEDFSRVVPIASLKLGEPGTVRGTIASIKTTRIFRRRLTITEARVEDASGSVRVVWFNQPYLSNVLTEGKEVNLAGELEEKKGKPVIMNPIHELAGGDATHTARIIPIYPETKGFTSRGIRYLVTPILKTLPLLTDPVPSAVRDEAALPELNTALRDIHFPANITDAERARARFIFEDFLAFQLYNLIRRKKFAERAATSIRADASYLNELIAGLPFGLTQSQEHVLSDVCGDIAQRHPMRRLLEGDVGSGKTVIASLAALLAARADAQSAVMAPTEILATQHFETHMRLFPKSEEGVALLTGSRARLFYGEGLMSDTKRPDIVKRIAEGKIRIVIGTHALIQKYVSFKNLALVVVDEQHRFGVEQRAALMKNSVCLIPHFLSMTATPIPRSLALTMWSDLDISYLTELPKGRKRIKTYVVPPGKRTGAYNFIRERIREGRQAFVICPRIAASENGDEVKTVTEEHTKLSRDIFPNLEVGLLHGRLRSKEKEEVMRRFAEGKTHILVATSVVEVGVDVPNAAVMMIEGADRFGLAQLYQLRGRVGRGIHESYCLLFTDSPSDTVRERLALVAKAKNGLELAEKDLALRGPGEFFGTTQTGMPDLAMKALEHPDVAREAKRHAAKLIAQDPTLTSYPALKQKIRDLIARIHKE